MTSQGCEVPADAGLRQLCLALRPELRRFLLARRVGEADADDLLQDLFLRVETSVTGPVRFPRAYLYQMLNTMAHSRRCVPWKCVPRPCS
ncbi:sigma factor [Novosphingobium sp. P6W]|uniref:sigma factor n=1 Tax=Novosphingobium sp. P6W TaxID=1609758 RepID=UPI001F06441E|nr:sigma factor [Novosphingobium sp. P6W]